MAKNQPTTTSDAVDTTSEETIVSNVEATEDGMTYELHLPQGISIPFSADFAVSADFFGFFMDRLSTVTPLELAEIQSRMRADLASQQEADKLLENLENSASSGGNDVADTRKFGYTISNGIAVVPLTGLMTKRPSCMSWLMGEGASTLSVMRSLRHADANPDVDSKLLLVDSPGGEVSGSFDLADMVRNGKKSTDAHIEDLGASAAYLAASGARHISANQNATVGSIGVYTKMVDNTAAMEARGYKVHLVKAGKHKAIGETGVPITADHVAHVQARVDQIHNLFLRSVTKGRENISKAQLAEVADAGVFIGKQAQKMGLVDKISDTPTALRHAVQLNKDRIGSKGNSNMVKDEELRAMLSGEPAAVVATESAATDATATTTVVANADNPLLTTLAAMGVKSVADLRGLAADALAGRQYLTDQRELATKLANITFHGADPANKETMASITTFLASAPLEIVQASIGNYRASATAQGLNPDKPRQSAPAEPAFAASIEEGNGEKPKAASSYTAKAYGNHPVVGGKQ